MKKSIIAFVALIAASPAFALDNVCATKITNAASYQLAQKLGVPVKTVEVLDFQFGMWTEAVGNNTGSGHVIVRAGNRHNRGMTIKKYDVGAQQIGMTDDCNILDVREAKRK